MFRVLLLITVFGLSACGFIPTDRLNGYSAAFDQAHGASDDFLVQFGQTKKSANAFLAAHRKPQRQPFQPYPAAVPAAASATNDADVETMRLGFAAVAAYNSTLVMLADGKSADDIGAAAKGLATALAGFVPVAGQAAGAVAALASELEKARLREEFRQSLARGAPVVHQILAIVAGNVDSGYAINRALADNARTLIVADMVDRVSALQQLVSAHKAPAAPDKFIPLADHQARLDALTASIAQETPIAPNYPYPLAFESTGTPYDAETEAGVSAILDGLAAQAAEYDAIIARMQALARSSAAYKQMLATTGNALKALERADVAPPSLNEQASELLRLAFLIKTQVEEIRAARAAM